MDYKEICRMNKYLYGELERCTLMHNYLREVGGNYASYTLQKNKLKIAININLKRLDFIWRTAKDFDRDFEENKRTERLMRMETVL
jgi:hypothetical protein